VCVIGFFKPTLFIRDSDLFRRIAGLPEYASAVLWMLEAVQPAGGNPPAESCRL